MCTFQKKKRGRRVPLFCHIIFIIIINDVDRVVVVECKKMRAWVRGTLEEKDDDVYDEKVIGRLRRPSAILLGRRSANAVHRGNKPTHR